MKSQIRSDKYTIALKHVKLNRLLFWRDNEENYFNTCRHTHIHTLTVYFLHMAKNFLKIPNFTNLAKDGRSCSPSVRSLEFNPSREASLLIKSSREVCFPAHSSWGPFFSFFLGGGGGYSCAVTFIARIQSRTRVTLTWNELETKTTTTKIGHPRGRYTSVAMSKLSRGPCAV